MKWTKEQKKVIDLQDRNILVSAAAGSGKTAVLVERIIKKVTNLDDPIDIDRLLIVTFTKAAASEMKERIAKALEKKLMEKPDDLHIQKQMMLIHNAQITTIHSFCKLVIHNYFSVINLEPGMRLADEAELILLKSDMVDKLLENYYQEGSERFYHFVEAFSIGKTDKGLEDMILKLYNFSVSYPWPKEWLEKQKREIWGDSSDDLSKSRWMKFLVHYIAEIVGSLSEKCKRARKVCLMEGGPVAYITAVESDLSFVELLSKQSTYMEYSEVLQGHKWEALKRISKKDDVDEELKNQVKALRDEVKSAVGKIKKKFFFQPVGEMYVDIRNTQNDLCVLIDLAQDFYDMVRNEKLEKKIMDFNDLEHYALDILIAEHKELEMEYSVVADELAMFYNEIMIDEYQDSNLVQELLLNSISKERFGKPNVFMVGDVKQSIYKFRLARPELFMEKFEQYIPWTEGESKYQRIDLHKNFRSRGNVLEFSNFIFSQIMQKKFGNIEYNQNVYLNEGAIFEVSSKNISAQAEVILINGDDEKTESISNESEECTAHELEARAIGTRILEMTGESESRESLYIYDDEKKDYKKVEYKDIVILLRTISGWSEDFIAVLGEMGIPAVSDTQRGYFSTLEVKTVLNLLSIIDNPRQDIPLAAVLYSPICGFSSEEMAIIRSSVEEKRLFDAIYRFKNSDINKELSQKVEKFLNRLALYRSMMPYTTIRKMIEFILDDTGYYQYVSVMPAGLQRAANLDMLLKKAQDFESSGYKGLFQFNRYIEKLHKYDIDFGEAFMSKDGVNAVHIMSIHKSKGLEFPVVFVSGLGKKFNMQDSRNRLIVQEDLGLAADYINIITRIKKQTLKKYTIQSKINVEVLGEELRVLYVAFTRAKEKLILTGYDKKLMKSISQWKSASLRDVKQISYLELAKATSYLDFIGPCLYDKKRPDFELRILELDDLIIYETKKQAASIYQKEKLLEWDTSIIYDQDIKKMVLNRLEQEYLYLNEKDIPVKFTVSELKKRQHGTRMEVQESAFQVEKKHKQNEVRYIPSFIQQDDNQSPVQRGIVYHKIMQEIHFDSVHNIDSIQEELNWMMERNAITREEMLSIDQRKILAFFQTNIAKRMIEACQKKMLFREKQFVIGERASQLPIGIQSNEMVLIQGVIDAYFEYEKELELIDYKTDYIAKGGKDEFLEQYRVQLDYYAKALEKLTGKHVKGKYLYSFYLDQWFQI